MHENYTRIYKFKTPKQRLSPEVLTSRIIWLVGILLVGLLITLVVAGLSAFLASVLTKLLILPSILIALTVHEYAHARVADFLGDSTPRKMGRLSLNPMKHLDFMGTIMLMLANFGWAKPVQVNPRNFRVPRRAMMSVALAGPISNMLLAILGMFAIKGLLMLLPAQSAISNLNPVHLQGIEIFIKAANTFVIINLGLMLFNLLPIPPLDGSRVISYILPPHWLLKYRQFEPMAPLLLIFFVALGGASHVLMPMVEQSYKLLKGFIL